MVNIYIYINNAGPGWGKAGPPAWTSARSSLTGTWNTLPLPNRSWVAPGRFENAQVLGITQLPSGYVKIAIENDPFIVLPIKNGDFP